jgi:hypothetical protein
MVSVDLYRGFRAYQQFNDWRRDFVRQQYILYFEGTIPKGNTTAEKVLSLARLVFPELRKNPSSSIIYKWRSWLEIGKTKPDEKIPPKALNYKVYSETIDLVLKSKEGYFIVKDFKDKIVTFKDLKQFINLVLLKFPNDIFRIVCVSTQYDTPFFQQEWLEQKMTRELMTKRERFLDFSLFRPTLWKGFSVDLLVVYKEGYSVLWIG